MKPIPSADSDAWNLAEGESKGRPRLIRYRPNLEEHLGDSRYPRRLIITWNYEVTNTSGMPSDQETEQMRSFEEALDSVLDPERLAILAFIYTHDGLRRWHYCLADVGTVGQRINEALSDRPRLPINLAVEDDPDWDELRLVFEGCRSS